MSTTTGIADAALSAYVAQHGCRETPVRAALREETARLSQSNMQISPLQASFLQMLARISGARSYLEIGVFTGYSSLAVAEALPIDGRIVACDVSEEWTSTARRYWQQAGLEHKIDLRLAPAAQTLAALEEAGETFDFAFIDADKENLAEYYERCLRLVRKGGFIAVDNVLWNGSVLLDPPNSPATQAIQKFNAARRSDDRVDLSLVPIADGVTLLWVR
ncbi:MAG: class I SAM-dependent methyltransferase [Alphaproteobacteria bacterium]|nr:class I SAM-dependent methyltransferase [Alphaproteobacteria bacterium]